MHKKIGAAGAAVLVVASIAAGCGGGGGSSPSVSSSGGTAVGVAAAAGLTKAKFVKEANAICKQGSNQIHSGAEAFKEKQGIDLNASLSKAQEEELVAEVVVPSIRAQADGLAKLGAPEGELTEVAGVVQKLEKVAEAGEEKPSNILQEGAGDPIAEVNKAAKAYGVDECMQP